MADDNYCRPEVLAFARLMEDRLRANDRKGGWRTVRLTWLFSRLLDEVAELHRAIDADDREDAADTAEEAADVANFAMMVADVCGGLEESDG